MVFRIKSPRLRIVAITGLCQLNQAVFVFRFSLISFEGNNIVERFDWQMFVISVFVVFQLNLLAARCQFSPWHSFVNETQRLLLRARI